MKNLKTLILTLALAASTVQAASAAATAAAPERFAFKQGGTTFAELSVSGLGTADPTFTLTLQSGNFESLFGQHAYASFLDLNASPSDLRNPSVKLNGPSDVKSVFVTSDDVAKPYDFQFSFGSRSDRLMAGETVIWDALFSKSTGTDRYKAIDVGLGRNGSSFGLQISGIDGNHEHGSNFYTASLVPTAPVPEPETYAMMVAGLGMMSLVARRRKARQS